MGTAIRKGIVPSDVYRNPVIEDMSVAAFQAEAGTDWPNQEGGFIARVWFPTLPEQEQSVQYYEIDANSIAQNKAQKRAPGTPAEEGTWNASIKQVLMEQYGYREKLPEELSRTMTNADEVSALSVAEVLAISDEVRVGAFWTTGVWARDVTGVASAPTGVQAIFWDTATGVPITNILGERPKLKLASKRRANTLILGADVVTPLLTNPQVIARVVNGQRPGMSASANLDDIAQLLKVDRVIVADAVYNSANENATGTATNQYILNSKSAWLGYVNMTPNKLSTSAGYRFTWQGLAGNSEGIRNWKYWDQSVRSFWVEGAVDDAFVKISANAGTFFSNIVQ